MKSDESTFQDAVAEQKSNAEPVFLGMPTSKDKLRQRVENDFKYHAPKPGQPEIYTELRERAKSLALHYVDVVPEGRELSTALTLLEQSVMEANAGIARHG